MSTRNLIFLVGMIILPVWNLHAQSSAEQEAKEFEMAQEAEQLKAASSTQIRQFHEVLNELLAEFGYDVKTGAMKGLKNLAIRKVRVSEALPRTYQDYIRMLISERIQANSKVAMIHCVSCRVKSSTLVEGKLKITSPETNVALLQATANQLGIDHFLDIMLVYHTTHMVLAFQVYKVETGELAWTQTYNSETIRSRYQKLAVDYSQVAKSRPGEEYEPDYRYLLGLGGAGLPNVAGNTNDNTMLSFQMRATERFDNRRYEFGLMMTLHQTVSAMLKEYPTTTPSNDANSTDTSTDAADENTETETIVIEKEQPEPFKSALAVHGVFVRNFLGQLESYNTVRHGVSAGFGGLLASGYVAGAIRVAWEIYLGRTFVANIGLNYIAPSQILVGEETVETKGGTGADVLLAFNL